MRAVMNAVMYILSTGCQWRYLPKDFPPWWHCDGGLDRIHHVLYVACHEKAEREASPTAAIIDSQSVKSAEKRTARPVVKWFFSAGMNSLHKRIRPFGSASAKMEIRAFRSS
jgi:transposase